MSPHPASTAAVTPVAADPPGVDGDVTVPPDRPAPAPDPWRVAAGRALHPAAGGGADRGWLWAVADGLGSVTPPWEPPVGATVTERGFECVLRTDAYEVWVLSWPPGTAIELHDHGASEGAFRVVAGELEEHEVAADGTTTTRRHAAGSGSVFGVGVLHAVANPGPAPATSVHVYSPPLTSMGFYDAPGGAEPVLVRVEDHDASRPVSAAAPSEVWR